MRSFIRRSPASRAGAFALCAALAAVAVPGTADADGGHEHHNRHHARFQQVNLVSDIPGLAKLLDPEVKNPWGIAFGHGENATPLWVNNQFNPSLATCGPCTPEDVQTKITLYQGANGKMPITKVPLEVTASSPTGIVFNPTEDFVINQDGEDVPARFLFDELSPSADNPEGPDSAVTGWSNEPAPAPTTTPTGIREENALFFGLALVPGTMHRDSMLLVADGGPTPGIQAYGPDFQPIEGDLFIDPRAMDQGMSPYNVAFLKGRVYVAYVGQNGGAVSVFTANGTFIKRLTSSRRLAGPWGMAIAPKHWGGLGRALLVGNVDDGRINAFNKRTGKFIGVVRGKGGRPLVNPGLWGIEFGNGVIGTPRTLIFAAGIGEELDVMADEVYEHGLVGLIKPVRRHGHHD